MRKLILFCLILIFFIPILSAQSVVIASGGEASGSGGSQSYSVGQILYTTDTGENAYIIHGIQQPVEISVVSSVNNPPYIDTESILFPVPARDLVNIRIKNLINDKVSYQLIDLTGKLLQTGKVKSDITTISLSNYAKGLFFLKINYGYEKSEIHKIIKN